MASNGLAMRLRVWTHLASIHQAGGEANLAHFSLFTAYVSFPTDVMASRGEGEGEVKEMSLSRCRPT